MTIKPKSFSIEEDHWEHFKELVESSAGKNKCSNVLTSFIGLVTQGYVRVQNDSNLTFLDQYKFDGEDLYDLDGESVPTEQLAISSPAPEYIPNVEFSSLSAVDIKSHPDWIQFSGESHQKIQQLLYVLQDQQQQIENLKRELTQVHKLSQEQPESSTSITLVSDFSNIPVLSVPEPPVYYPTTYDPESKEETSLLSSELEASTESEQTTLVLQSVPEIRSWIPWDNVVTEILVTNGVPLIPSTEPILLLKSTLRVFDSAPSFDGEVEKCKQYLQACLQESYNNPNYELTEELNLMLEKALVISGMNGMH